MSVMKELLEEFRTLVGHLEAEGHALAVRFRAVFHKVTGEPPAADAAEPAADAAPASEEGST